VLGSATLSGGTGRVTLPGTALEPGSHALTVRYLGDDQNNASSTGLPVTVAKAASTVAATVTPDTVKVKKDTVTAQVTVRADGVTPTGSVQVYVDGALARTVSLTDGAVSVQLGPFATTGEKSIELRYLGDAHVTSGSATRTVTVVKGNPKP
jgi:hypothetical protein